MTVAMQAENSDMAFRIFLRDGDISGKRRVWEGRLPRSGDYHLLVYLPTKPASTGEQAFTLTVGIQ